MSKPGKPVSIAAKLAPQAKPARAGRTLADFRACHNKSVVVPNKIRAALKEMSKNGPEHHEYELQFMRLAGVAQVDITKFREMFADHVVAIKYESGKALSKPKYVWFHDTDIAAELRDEAEQQ